jgi:pimeloyl-ACP methyl ester carboxylesterase
MDKFVPFFAARGFECHALDLRGHGQSEVVPKFNAVSLSDYLADVVEISKTMTKEPIIIGHSMGGLISQMFIQKYPAKAAVLLASCPPFGMKESLDRLASEHQGMGMKYLFTRNTDLMIKDKALTKELFFRKDFPDKLFDEYYKDFQTESYKAVNEMRNGIGNTGLNPNKIPVQVIGGGNDYFFKPKEIGEMAKLYGSEPYIAEGQGNTLMVEMGWQRTADEISDWLGRNGL